MYYACVGNKLPLTCLKPRCVNTLGTYNTPNYIYYISTKKKTKTNP